MDYDAPLTVKLTAAVDRRLRMLAILKGKPLNRVLDGHLDETLPPAGELASQLAGSGAEAVT